MATATSLPLNTSSTSSTCLATVNAALSSGEIAGIVIAACVLFLVVLVVLLLVLWRHKNVNTIDPLQQKIDKLVQDYNDLEGRHLALASANSELQTKHDELMEAKIKLQTQLHTLVQAHTELQSKYDELLAANNELQRQHNALVQVHSELGTKYDELASNNELEINFLRTDLDRIQALYDQTERDLEGIK